MNTSGSPRAAGPRAKGVSRQSVVCRAAKKVSASHREYIDRKKENSFFHMCIAPWPLLQAHHFCIIVVCQVG